MMLHRHFQETQPLPPLVKATPTALRKPRKKPAGYKAAVYAGTRNLYAAMVTAAKSVLVNSDVNKVYFLIEDDTFPYELPKEIECVNVAGQDIFRWGGPNFNSNWTYMVLMRAALTKIFPDLDRILSLDVDTIAADDISDLWALDMGDCVVAMVQEYKANFRPYGSCYWNAGVMLQDLKKLRESGLDDAIIHALNWKDFQYNEQCAINQYCAGRIYDLPVRYNDGRVCGVTDNPAIAHFVGVRNWQTDPNQAHFELLEKYRALSWDEVKKIRRKKYSK